MSLSILKTYPLRILCAVLSAVVLITAGIARAQPTALERLKGTWVIDTAGTLEFVQQSPKYTPEEAERLPAQLKLLRGLMRLTVTDKQVITARGDRKQAVAYMEGEVTADKVVLKVTDRGREVVMTFTLRDGGLMNMRSSATDDMDYFLWRKARPSGAARP